MNEIVSSIRILLASFEQFTVKPFLRQQHVCSEVKEGRALIQQPQAETPLSTKETQAEDEHIPSNHKWLLRIRNSSLP
jgi:hypothetical protein